jgi:hypothetical protein
MQDQASSPSSAVSAMTLALVLAWCLAGVRSSRFVKRCFPNPQYLLKAHLDFLMMTGLLFVFFLVFEHLQLTPPMGIVVAMSVGSMGNPAGFLALALKPDLPQKPAVGFQQEGTLVLTSCSRLLRRSQILSSNPSS